MRTEYLCAYDFAGTNFKSAPLSFDMVSNKNADTVKLLRPDRVQLLFDRKIIKSPPGKFRTRIITNGGLPRIHINYKSVDLKQYFKENRAARTGCTINNSKDFAVN